MIPRLATGHENNPSPPWGRGWPATALSPAVAGRVRGSAFYFQGSEEAAFDCGSPALRNPVVEFRNEGG